MTSSSKELFIKKKQNNNLRLLSFTTFYDRFLILLGCLCAIASGLSKPSQGVVLNTISNAFINYSKAIANNNSTNDPAVFGELVSIVSYTCFIWVILAILTFAVCFLQTYFLQLAGQNLSDRLQKAYIKSLLSQDVSWFDSHNTGSLISEMIRNLDRVKEGTGPHIGRIIHTIVQLLGSFAVCMYYNWRLGQIATCLVPLVAVWGKWQQQKLEICEKSSQKANREAGEVAEQALGGIRTVMYFNGQEYECKRYNNCLNTIASSETEQAFVEGITSAITSFLLSASCAATVYFGTQYVYDGLVEGGVVVMIFSQIRISLCHMNRVVAFSGKWTKALTAAEALFEVIEKKPEIENEESCVNFPKMLGKIEVNNINFSYPSRPEIQVLKGVNFSVESGQTVALVGASGCGKSTIIQLFQRLYDCSGEILIDGNPIKSIDLNHLRKTIGVVSQEPILFNATIEENIRYGRKEISEKEIWAALKQANAFAFVKEFPLGLQTIVGERGAQLSGGQKQRIAIARALVRDPKILLLDEATSALDVESEAIVQQALENVSKGRTTIVVAHRLSTIRNADQIIVMKQGKIVETGTHEELIKLKRVYSKLVEAQILEERVQSKPVKVHKMTATSTDAEPLRPRAEIKQLSKTTESSSLFLKIWKEARPEWKMIFFAIAISIIRGMLNPTGYFTYSELTNIFSGPRELILSRGHFFGLYYFFLAILQAACHIIQATIFATAAQRLAHRLRYKVYRNLMRQDGTFFDRPSSSSGHLLTRLATDVNRLTPVINIRIGKVIQEVFTDIVGCSLGLYYCWEIAIIAIPVFSMAILCATFRNDVMEKMIKDNAKDMEKCGQLAMEAISQIKTVKTLNLQGTFYNKFCDLLEGIEKYQKEIIFTRSFSEGILISTHYFVYAGLYFIGPYFIRDFGVDPQMFIRSMYLIGWGSVSLSTWLHYQPDLLKATVAAGMIFNMLEEEPQIDGTEEEEERPEIKGGIKVKSLHFSYPERSEIDVLKGINLELKPKQTIAVVGASGCGKSTLVSLLERLYDPTSGEIYIDGMKMTAINVSHLRANISIVSQEPILFDIPIRENIAYGLDTENISQEMIEQAARRANIHSFIASLPRGYQTRVGDKGTQLSGGQKQRIAIARALVREPKILILDEATSALDTESEKHVQVALDQAKTGRSCLVIAHRLSTIVNSDLIVVFKEGKVVEKGTHDELLTLKGVYFSLVQKQNFM